MLLFPPTATGLFAAPTPEPTVPRATNARPHPRVLPIWNKTSSTKGFGDELESICPGRPGATSGQGGEHNTHSSLGRAARAGMRQPAGFASLLAAPLPVAREFAGSLWVRLPLVRLGAVPRRRFLIGFAVGGRQGGRRPARGK